MHKLIWQLSTSSGRSRINALYWQIGMSSTPMETVELPVHDLKTSPYAQQVLSLKFRVFDEVGFCFRKKHPFSDKTELSSFLSIFHQFWVRLYHSFQKLEKSFYTPVKEVILNANPWFFCTFCVEVFFTHLFYPGSKKTFLNPDKLGEWKLNDNETHFSLGTRNYSSI